MPFRDLALSFTPEEMEEIEEAAEEAGLPVYEYVKGILLKNLKDTTEGLEDDGNNTLN